MNEAIKPNQLVQPKPVAASQKHLHFNICKTTYTLHFILIFLSSTSNLGMISE